MADKKPQSNNKKLVIADANSLRIAPRKMRLVTNLVKNMAAHDALTQLRFTNKKGAPMLVKLLRSAIANAEHNFSLKPESLFIKSVTCDMGKSMKRYFPRARGSAFVIRRKLCHVHVVLEERAVSVKKVSRFARLQEAVKRTRKPAPEVATGTVAKDTDAKYTKTIKTEQQDKANRVQQKRRPAAE